MDEPESFTPAEWDRLLDSVQIDNDPEIERLSAMIDRLGVREAQLENRALQDRLALRHQKYYRVVAGRIAEEMKKLYWVSRIVLFGSVSRPLNKNRRRYQAHSRRKAEIWHECRDIDLAVWVERYDQLSDLFRARGTAVNACSKMYPRIGGVPHFLAEVLIMDAETDRYLGHLCWYKECPKPGKWECRLVDGCGRFPLLMTIPEFKLRPRALAQSRTMELYRKAPLPGQ